MRSPPNIKTQASLVLIARLPNAGDRTVGAHPKALMQRQPPLESTAPSPDDQVSPVNRKIDLQLRSAIRIPRSSDGLPLSAKKTLQGEQGLGKAWVNSWLAGVAENRTLGSVREYPVDLFEQNPVLWSKSLLTTAYPYSIGNEL
jgi:hypothetical protein